MCISSDNRWIITTQSEADELYDCAADVMALPGGYKGSVAEDDDEQGDVAKALMTIAAGRWDTSIHLRYNSKGQNGLAQIKGQDDLSEFIENVHDGWKYAKSTMVSQFTRKMHKLGYGKESIDAYLQNGVLIRVASVLQRHRASVNQNHNHFPALGMPTLSI